MTSRTRVQYCRQCRQRQTAERENTPRTMALTYWAVLVIYLLPFVVLGVCITLAFVWGHGLIETGPWAAAVVMLAFAVYAYFHAREYKRTPFRCVVCRASLPY